MAIVVSQRRDWIRKCTHSESNPGCQDPILPTKGYNHNYSNSMLQINESNAGLKKHKTARTHCQWLPLTWRRVNLNWFVKTNGRLNKNLLINASTNKNLLINLQIKIIELPFKIQPCEKNCDKTWSCVGTQADAANHTIMSNIAYCYC